MKRFRLIFLCPSILFLIAFNVAIFAQQTPNSTLQTSAGPNAGSIILSVIVADKKGYYIGGLDKSNFTVYDNKSSQAISFFSAKDEPVSIGVIFDLSNSVADYGREYLQTAVAALNSFIKFSNPDNEYFVIGFADRMQLFMDWNSAGKAMGMLNTTSPLVKMGANTALYDACYSGVERMKAASHRRQVIILISDGQDNTSHHTFKDLRELLRGSNVLLYSVGISGVNDFRSSLGMEGQAILNELSAVTSGVAFYPDSKKQINEIFDHLAVELRQSYLLGFVSSGGADGRWHQLKIKVTTPQKLSLSVRSRGGYYARMNSK